MENLEAALSVWAREVSEGRETVRARGKNIRETGGMAGWPADFGNAERRDVPSCRGDGGRNWKAGRETPRRCARGGINGAVKREVCAWPPEGNTKR